MDFEWLHKILPFLNATGVPILAFAVAYLLFAYRKAVDTYKETSQNLIEENKRLLDQNIDNRGRTAALLADYREKVIGDLEKERERANQYRRDIDILGTEARAERQSMESHYKEYISEMKASHKIELAELKADFKTRLSEVDLDYHERLDNLDRLARKAVSAISELYHRRLELISEQKDTAVADGEKISSVIDTLRQLSLAGSQLKINQLQLIGAIENTMRDKETELSRLVGQISDNTSKVLIVEVFASAEAYHKLRLSNDSEKDALAILERQ